MVKIICYRINVVGDLRMVVFVGAFFFFFFFFWGGGVRVVVLILIL